ncbi:dynamin family protein [Rhodoferax sp. 4810]|uniref:Dynamin family protein n=1 Tax=Thiospirillum jenense TaxID=1653858 RepID=A0A839HP93_9GAMM|nr:dynamin family protein [Thiospirillum jenense]MBB1077305.1 dynamin family protein [Rhodoferax jenense]MBB1127072.1 dynamin family protein [Thiospirillum jenense]
MSTTAFTLDSLANQLPASCQPAIAELTERLPPLDAPLRVILLGAFSVGKSSLLNMLIAESLLPTAREETTALPTFIEYGNTRTLQLLNSDGSTVSLDDAALAQVATQAPAGAACASVTLPQDWLRGLLLIDLPGLGGVTARHQAYTTAQIQQADAVLYLIAPRGPDAADLATLRQIAQAGKRVLLLVARWDEVDAAVARGEQRPDVQRWAQQITAQTGLQLPLTPTSRAGLGRDVIQTFLTQARDERHAIRQQRLTAELRPLLTNALGQNAAAQAACAVESDAATQALRAELLARRQALLAVRSAHQAQAQSERAALATRAQVIVEQSKLQLDGTLAPLAAAVQLESDWEQFATAGGEALRAALRDAAGEFSALSTGYGELALPEAQVTSLNLRLPPPVTVDASEFLDQARQQQLQQALDAYATEYAGQLERLAQLPEADLTVSERALREVLRQRDQVAAQPLPQIVRQLENRGTGAVMGRMAGEIGDLALVLLSPLLAGTKAAAVLGKVAKTATTVRTVAQNSDIVPPPMRDRLKILEGLSLGYWGEQLGAKLDSIPREEVVTDPEALAQRDAMLAQCDAQVREVRAQLAQQEEVVNARQLTGWALEQNRREQAQLEARLADLQRYAVERQQAFEQAARTERQMAVQRQVAQAVAHWQHSFDQQAGQMAEVLRARVRDDWEARVEALLSERLADIDTLRGRLDAAPAERAAVLAQLQVEATQLQAVLARVQ